MATDEVIRDGEHYRANECCHETSELSGLVETSQITSVRGKERANDTDNDAIEIASAWFTAWLLPGCKQPRDKADGQPDQQRPEDIPAQNLVQQTVNPLW
jgi:hypothetical protein